MHGFSFFFFFFLAAHRNFVAHEASHIAVSHHIMGVQLICMRADAGLLHELGSLGQYGSYPSPKNKYNLQAALRMLLNSTASLRR